MSTTISGTSGVTFPDSTSMQTGQQACKAWVNFNGTGTVAIRGSYNVSSITDVGGGLFFINYSTALADINYAVLGSGYYQLSPTVNDASQITEDARSGVRTVNGVGISGVNFVGNAFADPLYASVAIFSN